MNRSGARYVGDPVVLIKGDRKACVYGAAMVSKHMPAFAAIARDFDAMLRPPATIVLLRRGDPDHCALTYDIPALMLPASIAELPVQTEFDA